MSAFAAHAATLLFNGYQPVPIHKNSKRPVGDGWRKRVMTPAMIAAETWYGLGVKGGFGRNAWYLVIVDVDVDDLDDVIEGVIPEANVRKRGAHGWTGFYKSRVPIKAKKYRPPLGKPLVELLQTGQSVCPPTIHPDTGLAYIWLTARTLLDTPLEELTEITPQHIAALEDALEPLCKRPNQPVTTTMVDQELISDKRWRAFALSRMHNESTKLSGRSDGRYHGLNAAAITLGKFVHHRHLTHSEAHGALMGACDANGLSKKRGRNECAAWIDRGLDYGSKYPLPDLDALPGAKPRRPSRWDDYMHQAQQMR